jgi:hypothetical protein
LDSETTTIEPTALEILADSRRGERVLVFSIVISSLGLAAFAMWLLSRKREQIQPQLGGMPFGYPVMGPIGPPQQRVAAPEPFRLPISVPAHAPLAGTSNPPQTAMMTSRLFVNRGVRVFQPPAGGARSWKIQARNIGPAGSFISLSTDSGFNPQGTIDIPAGGFNEFTIAANQVLFGRATADGIEVTIVASSEV